MADPNGKQAQRSSSIHGARWTMLVFAIAFVLNANTLTNGWALDDTLLITQNNFTRQGFSGIPEIWSNDVFVGYLGQGGVETGGRYRPLSHTVFALQYAIAGNNPFLGHLTNVLLYALTCALLFKLLARIFPESGDGPFWSNVPLLASILYALHPLHAEVVANIKSLDEILAMLFTLLTAWFAVKADAGHRARNLLYSGLSFFLALTAKENAITFLAIVPLVVWYTTKDVGRCAMHVGALVVPSMLYFILRSAAIGPTPQIAWVDDFLSNPFHGATTMERIATGALIFAKYFELLLLPWPLTTDYYPPMIPLVGWNEARAIGGALLVVAVCVFGWAGLRKRNMTGFGLLWFLITYSVVSNVLINLGTPMNDRFLFMPSAGAAVVFAALFSLALDRVRFPIAKSVVRSVILLVLVGFAAQTFSRNRDWHDDLTLFAHDVTVSDRSARCHVMYAKLLVEAATKSPDTSQKEHQLNIAWHQLERGLALYPDYALAHGLLGKLAMDRKDYHAATGHFIACLERDSTEEVALKNLAFIGRRMGEAKDFAGAERAFRAAIHFDPSATEPYLFLADALMRTGRADSSIVLLDHVTAMKPDHADAFRLKGEVYAVYLKQPALAEENFLKAHSLNPTNVSVTDNLGVAAFKRQDYPRALEFFLKGLQAKPDDAPRLRNVSETYRMMGDEVKASEFLRRSDEAERGAGVKTYRDG